MNSALMNCAAVVVVVGADRERQALLDHGLGPERLRYALFLADAFSVHPVAKSTTVRVRQNSPRALGPAVGDGVGLHVARQPVELVARLPDGDRVA